MISTGSNRLLSAPYCVIASMHKYKYDDTLPVPKLGACIHQGLTDIGLCPLPAALLLLSPNMFWKPLSLTFVMCVKYDQGVIRSSLGVEESPGRIQKRMDYPAVQYIVAGPMMEFASVCICTEDA